MYGLTEAFRSTYLPPEEIEVRPDSIGKAIPNAQVMVVRPDGTECAPGEPGELVHRGVLVSLGYWNDPEASAQRFRPAPRQLPGLPLPERAVWSGDQVRRDDQGYLYFVARQDDMIKTSGYRVSPSEVEEIAYMSGTVAEAAALGVSHPVLGEAIALAVVAHPGAGTGVSEESLIEHCRRHLPNFMVPRRVLFMDHLARSPNGKIDRRFLAESLAGLFEEDGG
jgi:acyl-CoA synthetase (AMP-forming)/AMP-acid ligase II